MPLLSVVIPMYNEKEVITETYKRLKSALLPLEGDYELIFVNDGSRDGTYDVLLSGVGDDDKVKRVGHHQKADGQEHHVQNIEYPVCPGGSYAFSLHAFPSSEQARVRDLLGNEVHGQDQDQIGSGLKKSNRGGETELALQKAALVYVGRNDLGSG